MTVQWYIRNTGDRKYIEKIDSINIKNIIELCATCVYLFAILLETGEEEKGVHMQKMFGYIGLSTLVIMWWFDKI